MNNKTRSILKGVAVILVLFIVLMQLHILIIPSVASYQVWVMVIAFGLLLISSK